MKSLLTISISLLCLMPLSAQTFTHTWPMIHGGPSHASNAQINITFPLSVSDVFPFTANREAGTAISEDKIFFSCYGNPNTLHCADLISGDSLWSFQVPNTGGGNQFSPAIAHGVVLSGGQSAPGLYGLSANTGEVLWLDTVGSLYSRSPAVYDSFVYVGSGEGLRCLDIATGTLLWRHESGTPQLSPAVDSQHVYFNAYGTNGGGVYAKNRLSGAEVWSTESVATGHSTTYIVDEKTLFHGYEDTITAFNKMTGDILWQTALDTNELVYYSGMAAMTDSFLVTKTVIDGSSLNHYRVIEKSTGLTRNEYFGSGFQWSAPVLINNYLVECGYNQIHFRDMMTGDSVYSLYNLGFGNSPAQPVAAKDKIILIGDANQIVILQSTPSGIRRFSADLSADIVPNPATTNVDVILELTTASNVRVSIVTINGALVGYDDFGRLQAGNNRLPVSIESLPSGMYFVQIKTENSFVTKKLFVEK